MHSFDVATLEQKEENNIGRLSTLSFKLLKYIINIGRKNINNIYVYHEILTLYRQITVE